VSYAQEVWGTVLLKDEELARALTLKAGSNCRDIVARYDCSVETLTRVRQFLYAGSPRSTT